MKKRNDSLLCNVVNGVIAIIIIGPCIYGILRYTVNRSRQRGDTSLQEPAIGLSITIEQKHKELEKLPSPEVKQNHHEERIAMGKKSMSDLITTVKDLELPDFVGFRNFLSEAATTNDAPTLRRVLKDMLRALVKDSRAEIKQAKNWNDEVIDFGISTSLRSDGEEYYIGFHRYDALIEYSIPTAVARRFILDFMAVLKTTIENQAPAKTGAFILLSVQITPPNCAVSIAT